MAQDLIIHAMAQRETDPYQYREFAPIVRGPLFALCALFLLGALAVVLNVAAVVRRVLRRVPT